MRPSRSSAAATPCTRFRGANSVPLRELITLNGLRPPYRIHPGQKLRLPGAKLHVVRRGDTLQRIARRYGVSTGRLAASNGIAPPYRIYPGQALQPSGGGRCGETPGCATRPARTAGPSQETAACGVARAVRRRAPASASCGRWRGRSRSGSAVRGKGLRNDGINILARRGTGVRAAENGVVAYSGNAVRGFGNLVLIKHAGGWMSAYAHNDGAAGPRRAEGYGAARPSRGSARPAASAGRSSISS